MVNTDQESSGFQTFTGNPVGSPITEGASYNYFLPSLNLSFQFPADQFLRLGIGRQMARPSLDDMRASNDISYNATRFAPGRSQANGDVLAHSSAPQESLRLNRRSPTLRSLLREYFGGKRGYVSAAYFDKDLRTYIYNQDVEFDINDTRIRRLIPTAPYPEGWYRRRQRRRRHDRGYEWRFGSLRHALGAARRLRHHRELF